ncbi:hypothetical protein K5D42_07145 [Pseudomonas cichorii]|nr:hypothetical protein [Pseudomonas cichorii]MBX8489645.1 hypothetical protein [Pseudomonas cichorii]
MNSLTKRKKMVSLTFRGFDMPAVQVIELVGLKSSRFGNKGEHVKPGVRALLARSYVVFSLEFSEGFDMCEMIPEFISHIGGLDHVLKVQGEVKPEFTEFNLDLPVMLSDDIQDGYLSKKTISDVFYLQSTVSFSYF